MEKAKDIHKFYSSLDDNEEEEENKNIFETMEIYENIDISKMLKYENGGIFMYSREEYKNINDIFI